jgi:metal-responsive CopG/Arc/MetJ family transcriptional regulator
MFGPSIKLDKDLYNRIKRCSDAAGYASPKELIQHVLERELAKMEEDTESDEEIVKKMQGLGYID